MNASTILTLYLVCFALQLVTELSLQLLNLKHVRDNQRAVPKFFAGFIDQETYARAISYTLAKAKFGVVHLLYSSFCLLLFVLCGWFGDLDLYWSTWNLSPYFCGIVYIFSLSLLFSVLDLPFTLYSVFVIEEKFGFNKMTFTLWLRDQVKGFALSIVLLTPVLYVLFLFMDYSGKFWWIYAFLFVFCVQLFIMYLYPVLIAPLFNTFEELEDGELKEKIFHLASAIGFRTSGIFVMDGSRRSSHGNAYFTGFGSYKRIVLFDTLIEKLSEEEAVAVLAHEMGHEKRHHVKKMLFLSGVFTLLAFAFLSVLIGYEPLFVAFGFERTSYHGALVLLGFASSPFTYFLSPLFSLWSRKHEYEADRFAVDAVGGFEGLQGALLSLSKNSLSNLTPHPWYSFFHYSHPTLLERLIAMRSYFDARKLKQSKAPA